MIENSTQGLTLLDAAHTVVVTGVEQHQAVLAPWAPGPDGRPRQVAAELVPAITSAGPHAGRRGIEVRIDGRRAGELTLLLSERHLPGVDDVLRDGGRPACVALVAFGPHELEMELRLPDVSTEATTAMSAMRPVPPPPARRRSRTPYLIGAVVLALLLGVGMVVGTGNRGSDLTATRPAVAAAPTTTPSPSAPATVGPVPAAPAAAVPLPAAPAEPASAEPTTVRPTSAPAPPATAVAPPPPPPAPEPVATATTVPPVPPAPTTTPTPRRNRLGPGTPTAPEPSDNCREADADGGSNIPADDPRDDEDLDGNEDGVACGPGDR